MPRVDVSPERPKPVHVLLLLPLALLGAWVWQRGRAASPDRGAVLTALRATKGPALPEGRAVTGAERSEIARYDRESLYEAIDGAADGYLARGFVSASTATYTFPPASGGDVGPAEIAAELYRFETAEGAVGQRDAERPASARPVTGLAWAEADGSVLLAVRGRDYLKLTSLAQGPAAAARLEALARATFQEKTP